jgi:hypothetical protein
MVFKMESITNSSTYCSAQIPTKNLYLYIIFTYTDNCIHFGGLHKHVMVNLYCVSILLLLDSTIISKSSFILDCLCCASHQFST